MYMLSESEIEKEMIIDLAEDDLNSLSNERMQGIGFTPMREYKKVS